MEAWRKELAEEIQRYNNFVASPNCLINENDHDMFVLNINLANAFDAKYRQASKRAPARKKKLDDSQSSSAGAKRARMERDARERTSVRSCDDASDDSSRRCFELLCGPDGELPERLRNLEPRLVEQVSNVIIDQDPNVQLADIAGLEQAKQCLTEMIIWPLERPDLFKGCRSPGRSLLLFGPPGTGKTMIGKAIARETKATFFYISASSLMSEWIGEGKKLVRALFRVASCRQPAVIFVDEIDSFLSQRKPEGEHDSIIGLKIQFLTEMEGLDSGNEQVFLIGATNRPRELDAAARSLLKKRLYIPLPSFEVRASIIQNVLQKDSVFNISKEEIDTVCQWTEGYSVSDMKKLVYEASMGPLREALKQGKEITKVKKLDMRLVKIQDFDIALQEFRGSVLSSNELSSYEDWNKQFGSLSGASISSLRRQPVKQEHEGFGVLDRRAYDVKDADKAAEEVRQSVSSNQVGSSDDSNNVARIHYSRRKK